jgi:hypothetical protein
MKKFKGIKDSFCVLDSFIPNLCKSKNTFFQKMFEFMNGLRRIFRTKNAAARH